MFTDDYIHDVHAAFDVLALGASGPPSEASTAPAASTLVVSADAASSGTKRALPSAAMDVLRSKYLHFIEVYKKSTFSMEELQRSFDDYSSLLYSESSAHLTKKARTSYMQGPTNYNSIDRDLPSSKSGGSMGARAESTRGSSGLIDRLFKGSTQFILSKVDVSLSGADAAKTLCYFTHPMVGCNFLDYRYQTVLS
jgi:hypothetical protein